VVVPSKKNPISWERASRKGSAGSVMIVVIPILTNDHAGYSHFPILTNDHAGRSLDLVFAVVCQQWQQTKILGVRSEGVGFECTITHDGSQLTLPSTLCEKWTNFILFC
jgi:hypothetical protein